jgi:hypothetical protein
MKTISGMHLPGKLNVLCDQWMPNTFLTMQNILPANNINGISENAQKDKMMTPELTWLLIAAGVIAIGVLLLFIRQQLTRLRQAKEVKNALKTKSEATRAHIISSIRVLARSIIAGQVEYSEACIRIKVLLDSLAPELHQHPDYAVFNRIYNATTHMPTHEARQKVDRRFLFKLDKQRWELESKNESDIKRSAENLLKHPLFG